MDFYDLIPPATKDMVRIFAAQGMATGQIGFMTHLGEETVKRILAEPGVPLPPELTEPFVGGVNTTSDSK